MTTVFNQLRIIRTNQLNLINKFSLEEINEVPKGFNNNLIWNFCHSQVTQQLLTYGLAGLPLNLETSLIDKFRKGSKASQSVDLETIEVFKKRAIKSVDEIENDFKNEVFKTFKTYPTSFGLTLENIEDALMFNNVHEGIHFGYMMALKNNIDG